MMGNITCDTTRTGYNIYIIDIVITNVSYKAYHRYDWADVIWDNVRLYSREDSWTPPAITTAATWIIICWIAGWVWDNIVYSSTDFPLLRTNNIATYSSTIWIWQQIHTWNAFIPF